MGGPASQEVPADTEDSKFNPNKDVNFVEVSQANAIFHDRDGKSYPAVIQNEESIKADNSQRAPRTYALLRVNFGMKGRVDWKDARAVLKDDQGTFNKQWYEYATAAKVEAELPADVEAVKKEATPPAPNDPPKKLTAKEKAAAKKAEKEAAKKAK